MTRTHSRRLTIPLFCIAALAAVAAVTTSRPAFAAGSGQAVKLRSVSSGVKVRTFPGGPAQSASADTALHAGMVVSCEDQGAELVYPEGTTVRLDPNSSVQLQHPTDAILTLGAATRVSRLDVRSGSIRVIVGPAARPILVAAGRDEYAVFRSGSGRLRIGSEGITTIVEQGAGMLASGGRWSVVPAGHYLTIGRSSGLHPLLPPPVFSNESCESTERRACAIAVIAGETNARVAARWNRLPAGQRSVVTLAADPQGANVIATQTLPEGASEFTPELPAGSYWLTVRALDDSGVEGRPASFPLRVLRLVADNDTFVRQEGNAAVIPPGRAMRIDQPEGIAIEEPGRFTLPQTSAVELRAGEMRRALRFSLSSNPNQFAWFTLHRRVRSADVEIGPGTAVWPRDSVTVSVQLQDNAPVADTGEKPALQLDINGVPEQIELTRDGARWVGQIAPRFGGGPWTIRADVLDREGAHLGHGVLHVISHRDPAATRTAAAH